MIRRAIEDGLPRGTVLADSACGSSDKDCATSASTTLSVWIPKRSSGSSTLTLAVEVIR